MTCPTGRENECVMFGKTQCNLCDGEMYFEQKKIKPKPQLRTQKKSNRMGSKFEEENHKKNIGLVGSSGCFLTPNSGAGDMYKGDEWISSFVTIMQELKTNVVPKVSRGSKTYTCKRSELEKVKREGDAANIEFAYLKFRFLESDSDTYSIISDDILDSIIVTLNENRKKVLLCDSTVNYYKDRYSHIEAKNVELEAKIKELESQIKLLEITKNT